MTYIVKGNPFTHAEESRASMPGADHYGGCDWCGQTPRALYIYNAASEPDGDRPRYSSLTLRAFCNKGCARSFGISV